MADTTRNIWKKDKNEEEKTPGRKKHPVLLAFVSFFLILVVVLGVVLLAAYRDGTGFDVLRRYLHYGKAEEVSGTSVYDYDADGTNHFAVLENHLVVLSETSLKVLSSDGETVWETSVNMSAPALSKGGAYAAAYDVGGTKVYILDAYGEVMTLDTERMEEGEGRIIAVTMNEEDWLAVTMEKQKYKSCVQVYDPEMKLAFVFNSSRRFAMDACVMGDGERLAAVTLGQEDSRFVSNVVLYELTADEPLADYDIEDGLLIELCADGDQIIALSDTSLTCADGKGNITGTYVYGDVYLREYDLAGDGFAALQLNRYQSGSIGQIITVGTDGTELGVLEVSEEILDISAAGRYLAVLYANRVVVYDPNLQVYASLTGIDQVRGVLMRPDGSVLLLSAESAQLFLP